MPPAGVAGARGGTECHGDTALGIPARDLKLHTVRKDKSEFSRWRTQSHSWGFGGPKAQVCASSEGKSVSPARGAGGAGGGFCSECALELRVSAVTPEL